MDDREKGNASPNPTQEIILVQPKMDKKHVLVNMTPEPPTPRNTAKGDAGSEGTKCPFSIHGCHKMGTEREVKLHIRDDRIMHLTLLCKAVLSLRRETDERVEEHLPTMMEMEETMHRATAIIHRYNGQFVFHIKNIHKCIENARKEKKRHLFSSSFESQKNGYKLMAILAPFGDGEALRENMSIFITILRSENDAVLPWPFTHPIKFTAVNMKGGADLTKTFVPNQLSENDAFFGRPKGERNAAFGIQNFCPLKDVGNFTVMDDFYVKIEVDVHEGKKAVREISHNKQA